MYAINKFKIINPSFFVVVIASVFSLVSLFYLYSHNLVLSIDDGRSHLDVARRVFDSLSPGLVQLGGIWLPLPHLLMLPLIWNDYLWHTGLAGVIPNVFCYIGSCLVVFLLVKNISKSVFAAFIAFLIIATNPSLLFLQGTPMTEPPSMFATLLTSYFFWRWLVEDNYNMLVASAIFSLFATLTRYEAWIIPIVICFAIIMTGINKRWKRSKIESRVILFGTVAFIGIAFWSIYCWAIFGDPLYYLNGEGSASWFALYEAGKTGLPTKGNILQTLGIYTANTIATSGFILLFLSVICLIFIIFKLKKREFKLDFIILISILFSPIFFNIYSLFSGHSVMWSDWFYPYKIYNVRYTLLALPLIALLIGVGAKYFNIIFKIGLLILITLQLFVFYKTAPIALYKDITQTKGSNREITGKWLKEHPTNGLTLISAGANEIIIFDSGKPIKDFIYEGNKLLWKASLKNPSIYASRIVMGSVFGAQTDKVYSSLINNPQLKENYRLVYDKGSYQVYDRIDILNKNNIKFKVIDTMKESRDRAKTIKFKEIDEEVASLSAIKSNYITVDTPYDEEFYPILKHWADSIHKINKNVWFRGNWSGWEGWFKYPKTLTRKKHIDLTESFILKHPELFEDGDAFTACPECEYGGPGNPMTTHDAAGFRNFLISEKDVVDKALSKINKKVFSNWQSMNPDVAKYIYNTELLNKFDGLMTLDYYAKDTSVFDKGLSYFQHLYPNAKFFIGEFGAPIPDINGYMTEAQQENYINNSMSYFINRGDIIGVNYWTCCNGTTAVLRDDLSLKSGAIILANYFQGRRISGKVFDSHNKPLSFAIIFTSDNKFMTAANKNGEFLLDIPYSYSTINVYAVNYKKAELVLPKDKLMTSRRIMLKEE